MRLMIAHSRANRSDPPRQRLGCPQGLSAQRTWRAQLWLAACNPPGIFSMDQGGGKRRSVIRFELTMKKSADRSRRPRLIMNAFAVSTNEYKRLRSIARTCASLGGHGAWWFWPRRHH